MCLSADWTGAPLLSLPFCFHPCYTKVLICSALTCSLGACSQVNRQNLSFPLGIECRCVCPHWTGILIPPITLAFLICAVVRVGPFLSAVHLLLALVGPVSVGLCLCASRVASFSWCCRDLLFRCCCSVFCCGCLFVVALVAWCLWFGPLFLSPPPSPWLSPGGLWSSQCSAGPPSGYLVVSVRVRLSQRYDVSWLIGSCLHSAPWQQRLRPCVGSALYTML